MVMAIENQRKLKELCKILQAGKLISTYKYALSLRGFKISDRVRSPQRKLTEEEKEVIRESLKGFL
jgi:dihydrodipicolinate synthase/N-acetylneuraminate lyase